MPDERTYGFNHDDAQSLIQSIGVGEDWFPEIKPRGSGGGGQSIEFTIISMDCSGDPWIITAEVTWYSGGCTAAIPGEDQYGYVEIQNRCNIANHFTDETIVGLAGTASYRYPRTGDCEPAWRLDDICGTGECGT